MESETLDPSEFSLAITKVAVSQICQSIGFKASQRSALETLTDVATRYLQALANYASSRATSSGRTHSNLFDLVHALEHLSSVQGFPGASDLNQPLLKSSTLVDIMRFVNNTDEIPFAKPIVQQSFPSNFSIVSRSVDLNSSSANTNSNSNSRFSHIPRWLPSVPDPSTYETSGGGSVRGGGGEMMMMRRCDWFDHQSESCFVEKGVNREEEKGKLGLDLAVERERVRFKMGERGLGFGVGVDMRNGVCRGGKRVSWQHNMSMVGEDEKEEGG